MHIGGMFVVLDGEESKKCRTEGGTGMSGAWGVDAGRIKEEAA
jgi:hypothetical protein